MTIMVVDDESEFRALIGTSLSEQGYKVELIEDGERIFKDFSSKIPDIILLDLSLPGKNGLEILADLKQSKEFKKVPVIMVTGHNDEQKVVQALNTGADDYITKPFRLNILDARIKAVLRRAKEPTEDLKKLNSGTLTIDLLSHQIFLEQKEIKLTLTEYKILVELVKRSGQVVTREQFRNNVLEQPTLSDRTLDVHMTALRKKLEAVGKFIHTIRGVGYRYSCDSV